MPHKTLHDRESITLGILTFGEFLTEPLDCGHEEVISNPRPYIPYVQS